MSERNDGLPVRPAAEDDAPAVARIYNQGIRDYLSTLRDRPVWQPMPDDNR